jgi:hypothetical protein
MPLSAIELRKTAIHRCQQHKAVGTLATDAGRLIPRCQRDGKGERLSPLQRTAHQNAERVKANTCVSCIKLHFRTPPHCRRLAAWRRSTKQEADSPLPRERARQLARQGVYRVGYGQVGRLGNVRLLPVLQRIPKMSTHGRAHIRPMPQTGVPLHLPWRCAKYAEAQCQPVESSARPHAGTQDERESGGRRM